MKRSLASVLVVVGSLGLALGAGLVTETAAGAAGSGYTPPGTPTTGGTASGLAGTVVSVTTICSGGGTASGTVGSATITSAVSAGTFPQCVQGVVTDATAAAVTPPGGTPIVTFGIGFYLNGVKQTGPFTPAVTVTITSSSITSGSTVYFLSGGTLQAAPGATVTNGSASLSITSDPTIEVVGTSSSTGTVPGATLAVTGKPFLLEGLVAAVLIGSGVLALVGLRLRRRPA